MKIKEILLKAKALIIILAVLAAIGWAGTIYLKQKLLHILLVKEWKKFILMLCY